MGPQLLQALLFSGLFTAIGLIILNVAKELPRVGWGAALRGVGIAHLGLALIAVAGVVVFAHDDFTRAPCVTVPNTSTTSAGTTTYTWISSCAGEVQPDFLSTLTTIFVWVVGLEAVFFCIGAPAWLLLKALRGGAP